MHIRSRSSVLGSTLVLAAVAIVPTGVLAQTAAQMEYERQQREYRQQQEQQRQEQQRQQQLMNENARRQQEESKRLNAPTAPGGQSAPPGQAATAQGSGQPGAQALEQARQDWLKRSPLPPERNPLLGRWKRPPSGSGNSSDPFAALQALAKGGLCEVLFGGGTFEFRASSLVGFDQRTKEQELDKVEYRGSPRQVVVLPKTTVRLMVFDVEGPDRVNWSGQNCVLVRVGPTPQDAARAAPSQSQSAGVAAPAQATASRGTVLSLTAGLQRPSGKYFPQAGTTFYVLKANLDTALASGGVQSPQGGSPLRAWITACESQQAATCTQGNRVFEANTVATLRTDLQGHAELGTLSAGTYYVYGGIQRFQQRNVLWNVRVDVREGANNSVKLDQANLTPLN